MGSAATNRVHSHTFPLPVPGEFIAGLVDVFLAPRVGEGQDEREDGPASGRGPPGHASCAAHAKACWVERGPGEDLEGEPPAAGATLREPTLALIHLTQAVAEELPAPPSADAPQQ